MKLKILLLIFIFVFSTHFFICEAQEYDEQSIKIYSIDKSSFDTFLKNVNVKQLKESSNEFKEYILLEENLILERISSMDKIKFEHLYDLNDSYPRCGSFMIMVKPDLIETFSKIESVEEFSNYFGIDGKVLDYCLFDIDSNTDNPSIILWLNTDRAQYMFEVNANISPELSDKKVYKDYSYNKYTIESYIKHYEVKNGEIYLNNMLLLNVNCKIEGNCFWLPYINILNDLGCEISQYEENFNIKYSDKSLKTFFPTQGGIQIIDEEKYNEPCCAWSALKIFDDDMYIYPKEFNKICTRLFKKSDIIVNIDNKRVDLYLENKNISNVIILHTNIEKALFLNESVMENDRTLVPMRAIFEALGAEVEWENETQTATATKDGIKVSVTIDSNRMQKNGEEIKLDVPARLVGDSRTLVPLRAVSEAFGCQVEWDEELQRVDIYTK